MKCIRLSVISNFISALLLALTVFFLGGVLPTIPQAAEADEPHSSVAKECLLYVDCILEGTGLHGLVYREGDAYPLSSISCLISGDSLNTYSDRVQLKDSQGHPFRIGSNTITRYGVYDCLAEDYAIYLDLGELYAAHKCVKIRTSCWADRGAYYPSFFRQESDSTSHYFALTDPLSVVEYDTACIDTLLFMIEERMHAITTGYWGEPDYQVVFEPISYEDSVYIFGNYGYNWCRRAPSLTQWSLIALLLVFLTIATWVFFRKRKALSRGVA